LSPQVVLIFSAEYASAIEGIEYYEDMKEAIDITPTFSTATHVDSLNSLLDEGE